MNSAEWQARIEYGGRVVGTGFLVTPRKVVTCAHVIRDNDRVTVTFTEHAGSPSVTARVAAHGGWAGHVTASGDLAVLELDEEVAITPAALAPADAAYGEPPRKLVVHGFPSGYLDEGVFAECRTTSRRLLKGEWVQLEAWTVGGQPLAAGFSGAAVTLADTGEVVGMVTAASGDRDVRNGRMMPTHVMARYWQDLEGMIPTRDHPAADRTRLRGLVERAVRAGVDCDPVRLYSAAAGSYDPPTPPEGFDSLWSAALFVLCDISGPEAADTVTRFADRLEALLTAPAGRAAAEPEWAPILVELGHSGAGADMVRVEVSAYSAGRRHPVGSGTVPRERLRAFVQDRIEEAFPHLTPGGDELIAFSLPRDWLDWPVDRWGIAPDDDTPLGCVYPVVVTDHARRKAGTRHLLTRAWNRLDSSAGARVHRVECGGSEDPRKLRLTLRRSDACLAGFAAAPRATRTRPHFEMSLTAPAPVIVWSRGGCEGVREGEGVGCAGVDGCTGKAFLDELDAYVSDVAPAQLPRRILALREEADAEDPDGHWAREIQLLWDDPRCFTDPHYDTAAHVRSPVA